MAEALSLPVEHDAPVLDLRRFGRRALDVFAGRLALLHLAVAATALPWAVGPRNAADWIVLELPLALCVAACLVVFRAGRTGWWPPALLALAGGFTASALAFVGDGTILNVGKSAELTGLVIAGVGGGLGLSRGIRSAAGTVAVILACYGLVQPQTLTSPYAFAFLGAFTYVVGGSLVRWAADRGFASTERALAGAEQAVAARHLALERWRVGRAEERRLHDTVLATLTLLAHGGDGLDDADLRRYCARDVDVLAGRGEVAPTRVPVQAGPASADGVPARDLLETLVLDAASLRVVLRVHVASESAEVRIDGTVARALHDVALEGIRNVRRHAHVDTADLTLLTTADDVSLVLSDEGAGFDSDADRGQGLGLRAAAERMLDVGGRLTVWSRRDAGASLVVMAPTRRPPAVVGRREELRE